MPYRLLYTGQVVIDLTMHIDHLPEVGQEVVSPSAKFEVGGGFNVMAAASRNGLSVSYLGGHGTGHFGDQARQAMNDEGIDIVTAALPHQDTGISVALTDAQGERSFISTIGAESCFHPEALQDLMVTANDYVAISGYSLMHEKKYRLLVDWLEEQAGSGRWVFDPGPLAFKSSARDMHNLLPKLALWSSNREEALSFTGTTQIQDALSQLAQQLPPTAVTIIRDGRHGCWIAQGQQQTLIPGFSVDAIDTNGAGDAHLGVFLTYLAKGYTPLQAAYYANAAAAIAVTRFGPATCPTEREINALVSSAPAFTPS